MIRVHQVKQLAQRWVEQEPSRLPGFRGAFLRGSINSMNDRALFPAPSDVDIAVITDGKRPAGRSSKFLYADVILEVTYPPAKDYLVADELLADYRRVGGFERSNILSDPSGGLSKLQSAVSREFTDRKWVRLRCEDAMANCRSYIASLSKADPIHTQAISWNFATGITTHVLLAAGLKNATVRKRYVAVRELLTEYGKIDLHETLLDLLGCAELSRDQVEQHLQQLAVAFDHAIAIGNTSYPFSSDISALSRPIAIDGSRELIESGLHREAVFWLVTSYARCQTIFSSDASPEIKRRFEPGFKELLADLGIAGFTDFQRRTERLEMFLPELWLEAEAIMSANPEIRS